MIEKRILFLGMPGAGKGTQAKLLAKQFGFAHISTGEIIRNAWKENDPILSRYRESIERGNYLPNRPLSRLLTKAIYSLPDDCPGYILDGAVRTIPQARFAFEEKLINLIFELNISEDTARERLALRGEKEGRKDDSPEAIDKRFEEYYNKTFPVITKLRGSHNLYPIPVIKSIKGIDVDTLPKYQCYASRPSFYIVDASSSRKKVNKTILKFLERS
jgi:adenylate kinase